MKKKIFTLALLLISVFTMTWGQCKIENTFFKEGETLIYDMYFKLGFTSTNAGKLKLTVSKEQYQNEECYKMTFQTNTSGLVNSIFAINDTLYAYMSKDLQPVAYMKRAMEGGDYTKEDLSYTYKDDGKIDIRTIRHKNGEFRFDEVLTSEKCIYDLVSVVYYARTIDFSKMNKGDEVTVNFISGKKMSNALIEYKGEKNVKGNDGKRYDCIDLELKFTAGGGSAKSKEMMKVAITNDKNRVPIQIESKLKKIGSVKGTIKSYSGLKN